MSRACAPRPRDGLLQFELAGFCCRWATYYHPPPLLWQQMLEAAKYQLVQVHGGTHGGLRYANVATPTGEILPRLAPCAWV